MAFVDECTLYVASGRGGDGSVSMHSEPYKARGGPDGGSGGNGGSVILEVTAGIHDLSSLSDHPHQRAAPGANGRSTRRDGASGKDLVLPVPDGTVVFDDEGFVADLTGVGSRAVVAAGGRGGRGNSLLTSSRNRAPRFAEPGESAEVRTIALELRTVADVGLVGLPNAGKSTLLSRLTAAKPKIADYPFTTLTPNLGVAGMDADRFVVADVPGLIEGAAEGKGLGHRFLRHVVRCRALVLVVDLSAPDPAADLGVLRAELAAYDETLAARPAVIAGTKADLVEDARAAAAALDGEVVVVSSMTGDGVYDLLERLGLLAQEGATIEAGYQPTVVLRPGRPRFTVVRRADGGWEVSGRSVERWIQETDLEDDREVAQLQTRLKKEGVDRKLAALGAQRGDDVHIKGRVFEYVPDVDPAAPSEPVDA
ncbi:MAG: GTPase ObgE [Actinomycetota bacterium]|jgi:GTP-binding protein